MVLSTHSVIGATAAVALTTDPLVGLGVGFVSHFVLDMLPHWDYTLSSKREPDSDGVEHATMVFDRSFLLDCVKMGVDLGLGIVVVGLLALYTPEYALVLSAGLIGGVLPDMLQFCYFLAPRAFGWLQAFHEGVHTQYKIYRPLPGAIAQILLAGGAVLAYVWMVSGV